MAEGIRMEPPRSEPMSRHERPAATAAALPPLDPPVTRPVFQGLQVGPNNGFVVSSTSPSISATLVLPTMKAPAARSRFTTSASVVATLFFQSGLPHVVGMPDTSIASL